MHKTLNLSAYETLPPWAKILVVTLGVLLLVRVVIPLALGALGAAFALAFALVPLALVVWGTWWAWRAFTRGRSDVKLSE